MSKRSILKFIFTLVLTTLFFQACSINKNESQGTDSKPAERSEQDTNESNIQSNHQQKVTIEQIKDTYKPGEILDIKTYDNNYVLVKSHQVRESGIAYDPNDKYTFYNLKTGDADILDTAPFIVESLEIKNPNHLNFYCNGQNIMAPFHDFPFILSFEREEEDVNSDSDFIQTRLPQYYPLDKGMVFGDASYAVISNINISSQDIEVAFSGSNGPDDFILADGRIPVTKVSYKLSKNQIIYKFDKSYMADKYKGAGSRINQGNDYMDSVELNENPDYAEIIINLKSSVKQYSCQITGDGALKIFFSK